MSLSHLSVTLVILVTERRYLSNMSLALRKFNLEEDKLEINSKYQPSFLLSLKVELMLSLGILKRLKSLRWFYFMYAKDWIYWKEELLQHVNMKLNNKFYRFVNSFHLTIFWQVFELYFNPTIFHHLWTQSSHDGPW